VPTKPTIIGGTNMKEKKIKVVLVVPEKTPMEIVIDNELSVLQSLVGGRIECVRFDGYDIVINEEGKLEGLQPNFLIYDGADYIAGTCIFTGVDYAEGEFKSLSDEQIEKIKLNFRMVNEN
jgi:hypothetical protein